jgi:hypothetical protein
MLHTSNVINLHFSFIHYVSDHTPWGTWNFMYCTGDIHKFQTFHILQQNVSYRLNKLTLYNKLMWLQTERYIILIQKLALYNKLMWLQTEWYIILIQKLALQLSRTIFNFGSNGISTNSILEYRIEYFKYNIAKHDQSYHFPKALRVSICKVLHCFLMIV